jgi:23S rRNA pseudouridine1911/1915/1917 synthase
MNLKIIYEDNDVLVIDKPAGIVVFEEGINPSSIGSSGPFLINELIKQYPQLKDAGDSPRYGVVHRLDKDTSGILLVAKTKEALIFLQNKFKNREVEKKYTVLATGIIKDSAGKIEAPIGRSPADPRKQKAYSPKEKAPASARDAITDYKVLQRFQEYTLLEVMPKTGRKHQVRCHLAYIHHPVAGDKLYGFKDSPKSESLERQFLHAYYMKIQLPASAGRPNGKTNEFYSELPEDLTKFLKNLQ